MAAGIEVQLMVDREDDRTADLVAERMAARRVTGWLTELLPGGLTGCLPGGLTRWLPGRGTVGWFSGTVGVRFGHYCVRFSYFI